MLNKGSIWRINHKLNSEPDLVIVVSALKEHQGVKFYRVRPISSRIEMRTEQDLLVEDQELIGYPFFVEEWNEQAINSELLIDHVADISVELLERELTSVNLTEVQKQFRKSEIARTDYVRNTVYAYLNLHENDSTGENIPVIPIWKSKTFLRAAASLILITTFAWLIIQPGKLSNDEVFDFYTSEYPLTSPHFTEEQGGNLRGEECSFENLNSIECEMAYQAFEELNLEQYSRSAELLRSVLINPRTNEFDTKKNSELSYYLALLYLKEGNYDESLEVLSILDISEEDQLKSDVEFYKALVLIKLGRKSEAKQILKASTITNSKYKMNAELILNSVRWF